MITHAFRRRAIASAVALLCTIASSASAQLLKCETYKLDNGLTVILHVDHRLPQAAINLWYHVGAKNEPAGRSGFAHLFEHLMFMGTKRVPGIGFDTLMEAGGGKNNASTDLDRTNFFSDGPSELLPTLLWLDADRMEALGANMTSDKLDRQRDIVRNEIRQQVENTPYGRAYEDMFRYMYPASHPYHNAVYGTHADLEAATQTDVRDFFATFYNPSNCSLVVAGDFDPATIKPLIARLFGSLPAGNAPKDRTVEPTKLDRVVRATILDKVELPKLLMVYHAPGQYRSGDAEASLAAQILGDGQNSRLYQRLVLKDSLCTEVSAYLYPGQLQSLMLIDVNAKPGTDLAVVEKAVDEEVARLKTDGPTAAELSQRKSTLELGMLTSLQSVTARADKLNEYEFYLGEPDSLQRDLDRFRKTTSDSIRDVVGRVFRPDARLILTVLPEQGAGEASARDEVPAATSQPATFAVPRPQSFTLDSGIKVELFQRSELPLISARLVALPRSLTVDPADKAGRTELLSQMMDEGTAGLDGPAFAAALQAIGADFSSSTDRTSLTTSIAVLDRNFAPAAKLWLDATFRPRMLEDDFSRVKQLHLDNLAQQDQEPASVAGKVGAAVLFGRGNAYGVPEDGTAETVANLTLNDLKTSQTDLLDSPTQLTLFVAGNVSKAQVLATLNPLIPTLHTHEARPEPNAIPAMTTGTQLRVAIVDRPDAPQTAVRLLAPGIAYEDAQRIPLRLMNTILGGSFTSRLNSNLREAKGYTYGAGSQFVTDRLVGWFVASADVKSDVTGPAVKEMLAELRRIGTADITAGELAKAQQAYRANLVERFGTLQSLLVTASTLEKAGVPFDSLDEDLRAVSTANVDQLDRAAKQYPRVDSGILVLVGDEKLIRDQLKTLDLPDAVSYGTNGEPLTH